MLFFRILQVSPILVYSNAIFLYCFTQEYLFLRLIVELYIFNTYLNPYIKEISKYYFQNNKLFERPNPPKEGCGFFSNTKCIGAKSFGFPSGHSQIMFYNAIFFQMNFEDKYYLHILLYIWAIAVCIQRVMSGCHNNFQVIGGALIGFFLSKLIFLFSL